MKFFIKTVLLVDDYEIDNIIHEKLIQASNFAENIIVRQSGDDAIDFLNNEAVKNNQIPDLIFLDIRMHLGDGFEFLEKYSELPNEILIKTKIVMLTSSLDDRDYERALKNRFVKFLLTKPLSFDVLDDLRGKL